MKRFATALGIAVTLPLLVLSLAAADVSKDEKNLDREAKRVNDTAAKPDGEKAVQKELSSAFKTSEPLIRSLRDRKLGYGEIAIVLSLAQTLPGGAIDANVQKVLAMREGSPPAGWGEVGRRLNTKLGTVVSQVRKVANNANREIKNDHARAGKAPTETPPEQKNAPQEPRKQNDQGEGRLLRQGSSAQ